MFKKISLEIQTKKNCLHEQHNKYERWRQTNFKLKFN